MIYARGGAHGVQPRLFKCRLKIYFHLYIVLEKKKRKSLKRGAHGVQPRNGTC